MNYIITAYETKEINLAPETIEEEILQNITMILSTPQFSVPLDRGFGLSQRFVDKPTPIAKTICIAEILDAIEKYEPRVEVLEVTFKESPEDGKHGKLIPQVEVKIIDG